MPTKEDADILVLCKHYLPGFRAGGPIKSIANLCSVIGTSSEHRKSISVFTLNRDAASETAFNNVETNQWNEGENERIYYSSGGFGIFFRIFLTLVRHRTATVYLNSWCDPRFSLFPLLVLTLLGRRDAIRIAPRGELSEGALSIKPRRKQNLLLLSRWFGLHNGLIWHATSSEELDEIKLHYPSYKTIHLLENVANLPLDFVNQSFTYKSPGKLNLVFLSRITPKKNLKLAIETLSKITDIDVRMDIVGPIRDDTYWAQCQSMIKTLPTNININYIGEVNPQKIPSLLTNYDLFFLPTLNENYGHVIVEALSSGCPVLISDQTPWKEVEKYNCGWIGSTDDIDFYKSTIESIAAEDNESWLNKRKSAIEFVQEKVISSDLSEGYSRLLSVST
ncbi:MAG: glycosyltransferase [Pseudomonadales bacterium]|nr:glycosyltransferase [Pseudomonadales bacterium]